MPAEWSLNTPEAYKLTTRPDVRVAELAAEQWGVLSTDEMRACGLSLNAIAVRARNGWLHRLYRGVYATGHPNVPIEGRFLAAVKASGPGAVLSHFSAAALYELVRWDGRYPQVTTTSKRAHHGIRIHRSSVLAVQDTTRHRGIPITTPARTLVDLAATFEYRALRRTVREALRTLVTTRQLVETLDRLGARRGVVNLARIVAAGHVPTRSELEDTVLDLLLNAGFERPDVNVPIMIGNRRIIPDFGWPAQRLIIEADGAAYHDNRLAREDDAERQAILEAHGERVVRVTWAQALIRRAETLARIRAAGAPTSSDAPRADPATPVRVGSLA
jgi:predicted transcriptional regulator of viral defense system/very-short-patch-repair endonuclease